MTEPTVDDLPAEADALEVVGLELGSIGDGEVREPHRHAYNELIWVREGRGRHLIDGEPVEFGPRTLTLIAKGQVHQFQRAEQVSGVVARFGDEWLAGSRRWLFAGQTCTPVNVPEEGAKRFDDLLELLRVEVERPPGPESAELRSHLLTAALLWAERWREADLEDRGASGADVRAPPALPGDARARLRDEPRGPPLRLRARGDDGHAVADAHDASRAGRPSS